VPILIIAWSLSAQDTPRDQLLKVIEGRLETGRHRQALTEINYLFRSMEPSEMTPRFLFIEARVLLANGFTEDAQNRLDTLKTLPDWEKEVDPTELLTLELEVLQGMGRSVEALNLLEDRLPYLDEIDPPYSPEDTQLLHVHSQLLFVCSQYEKAVDTAFNLLEKGAADKRREVAATLLDFAYQKALREKDFERLPAALANLEGPPLWHRFALVAQTEGHPQVAQSLIDLGIAESAPSLRALWPEFLSELEEPAFLELAAERLLHWEKEAPDPAQKRLARSMAAYTLEKLEREEEALELIQPDLKGDLDLRFFAARIHARRGDLEKASAIYEELEKAQPGFHLDQWGTMLAEVGQTEKAFEVWNRIPETASNKIDGYRRLGNLLKEKGFPERAKEAFLEGIEATGQPVHFANELLDVSLAMGDVEGTLVAYQTQRDFTDRNQVLWAPPRLLDQLRRTQQVESFSAGLERVLDSTASVQAPWRDFAFELQTELLLFLNDTETFAHWLHQPPPALAAYWEAEPGRKSDMWISIGLELTVFGEDRLACEVFEQIDPASLTVRRDALEASARCHTNIGDSSRALELWRQVFESDRSGLIHKQDAALAMARILIDEFQPGQGLVWLDKFPEGTLSPNHQAEAWFLKGLAYTRLHDRRKATGYLQRVVDLGRNNSADAAFWLAEWELWQRERDRALEMYREILGKDPGQDLANDVLWRLRHLAEVEEETLPYYSMAAFFEAGGQFKEAEENYRKLASTLGESDLSDWVYYRIGAMAIESGSREAGFAQWRTLLDKTGNETLKRRVRFEMAALNQPSGEDEFQALVMEQPDSLLGDLARQKMKRETVAPVPTQEPVSLPVP
jgi:tetratricopeptide (TPR) repeat protein